MALPFLPRGITESQCAKRRKGGRRKPGSAERYSERGDHLVTRMAMGPNQDPAVSQKKNKKLSASDLSKKQIQVCSKG